MKFFNQLTNKQLATIAMLAIANLCGTVVFSCIGSFYPKEAKNRRLSDFEIGLVFGFFQLVMFFFAPFLGKYMHLIGSKRMCIAGLLLTAVSAIVFGTLTWVRARIHFFYASLLIRSFEAFGEACFLTASLAICAKCFPGRINTVIGIIETFSGFGYTIGPAIGGVLYEKCGGFEVPFFVFGSLLLVATLFFYFLIDEVKDELPEDPMGMFSMLKIPAMWLMLFAVVLCAISLTFLDPILSEYFGSAADLSAFGVGLMFLLCDGSYSLTAALWGLLMDRWKCSNVLMFFGSAATILAVVGIGMTGKQLVLVCISLAILGLASSALYIPSFQRCLNVVKRNGYDDNFQTYGCVSGLFQSFYAFGGFIGPTFLGGLSVQIQGLPNTTWIVIAINMLFILALLAFVIKQRFFVGVSHFVDEEAQSGIILEESQTTS